MSALFLSWLRLQLMKTNDLRFSVSNFRIHVTLILSLEILFFPSGRPETFLFTQTPHPFTFITIGASISACSPWTKHRTSSDEGPASLDLVRAQTSFQEASEISNSSEPKCTCVPTLRSAGTAVGWYLSAPTRRWIMTRCITKKVIKSTERTSQNKRTCRIEYETQKYEEEKENKNSSWRTRKEIKSCRSTLFIVLLCSILQSPIKIPKNTRKTKQNNFGSSIYYANQRTSVVPVNIWNWPHDLKQVNFLFRPWSNAPNCSQNNQIQEAKQKSQETPWLPVHKLHEQFHFKMKEIARKNSCETAK